MNNKELRTMFSCKLCSKAKKSSFFSAFNFLSVLFISIQRYSKRCIVR